MKTKLLTIPGYLGSGKTHWQTRWEKEYPNIERIQQRDWDHPHLSTWLKTLDEHINKDKQYNSILIAHSLGCALVAHWGNQFKTDNVIGAFLVSTSDVDSAKHTPDVLRNFSPMPTTKLPFPSLVVASENDPYVSIKRSQYFAKKWGAQWVNIGKCGHINAESCLGSWDKGKCLLEGASFFQISDF